MPSDGLDPLRPRHVRSLGFLDHDGRGWACFLVTWRAGAHRWKGHLLFRSTEEEREVETAELFLETSERDIDRRARGLGRPLLRALFESALEVEARAAAERRPTRGWLRNLLTRNAEEAESSARAPDAEEEAQLRSRYASYRIDQVGHLVALMTPDDFDRVVERILEGRAVEFGMKDRLQFALAVVEHLERLLPLPPFEVWREDVRAHPDEHAAYLTALRDGGPLP